MDTTPKKKLCWNCEGSVSKSIANCPYCGVYLHRAGDSDDEDDDIEDFTEESEENNVDSSTTPPLSPPYRMVSPKEEETQISHTPPYITPTPEIPPTLSKEHPEEPTPAPDTSPIKYALVALVSLILGVTALLFSFILLFFSHHGILTLRWSAELWYLYFLISIPLLIAGWFALKHIKD